MASNAATREGRIEIRATKEEKRILVAAAVEERLGSDRLYHAPCVAGRAGAG